MAFGKRPRRDTEIGAQKQVENLDSETDGHIRIIFQKHFETQFRPLSHPKSLRVNEEIPEAADDGFSEWDGLSQSERKLLTLISLEHAQYQLSRGASGNRSTCNFKQNGREGTKRRAKSIHGTAFHCPREYLMFSAADML